MTVYFVVDNIDWVIYKGNMLEFNSKLIEAHRTVLKENPRKFSIRLGVSHQWYYDVVAGKKINPRIETINKVADALGLDPKDLIK